MLKYTNAQMCKCRNAQMKKFKCSNPNVNSNASTATCLTCDVSDPIPSSLKSETPWSSKSCNTRSRNRAKYFAPENTSDAASPCPVVSMPNARAAATCVVCQANSICHAGISKTQNLSTLLCQSIQSDGIVWYGQQRERGLVFNVRFNKHKRMDTVLKIK